MAQKMTFKERFLALLQGRPMDQVPFMIYDMMLPTDALDRVLGPDRIGLLRWSVVHRIVSPNCRMVVEPFTDAGLRWERRTLVTPVGTLYEEKAFEPAYDTGSIRSHFVKEPKDYDVLCAYLEDCQVVPDMDRYYRDEAELGDRGWPLVAVHRCSWQQLWVQWAGIEDLGYHLCDDPDRVERAIGLMQAQQREIFEIAAASPAPFVDFPDNITAPCIGPRRFRKYCVPMYNELADMLAERGAIATCHMDGDLKPLWKDIGACGLRGLDSFAPAPDNDTSVAEAITMWPDKRLFVNFPSSVHLREPEQVRQFAEEMLAVAGHSGRLEIQISENVPHSVWRTTLPIIADACEAFGAP